MRSHTRHAVPVLTAFFAAVMLSASASAQVMRAPGHDAVQAYWSSFPSAQAVEADGLLRPVFAARDIWSSLDHNGLLVLADTLGGRSYELVWFANDRAFGLLVDGHWVEDLTTFTGADGRPHFAGAFDRAGEPAVEGLVDVDSGDLLMVQIDAPDAPLMRAVTVQGLIIVAGKCKCVGKAKQKADCSDADCSSGEECHVKRDEVGAAFCKWQATHYNLPVDPGGDR